MEGVLSIAHIGRRRTMLRTSCNLVESYELAAIGGALRVWTRDALSAAHVASNVALALAHEVRGRGLAEIAASAALR